MKKIKTKYKCNEILCKQEKLHLKLYSIIDVILARQKNNNITNRLNGKISFQEFTENDWFIIRRRSAFPYELWQLMNKYYQEINDGYIMPKTIDIILLLIKSNFIRECNQKRIERMRSTFLSDLNSLGINEYIGEKTSEKELIII